MKKKWIGLIIGVLVVILVVFAVDFCAGYFSRLQIGKEITELLQPVLSEKNKKMHLDVSADLAGEVLDFHSDISFVKEEETNYVVMDQYDVPIYIVDNVLYLENGHAFLLSEKTLSQSVESEQSQSADSGLSQSTEEVKKVSYSDLFVKIAAAYEIFDITCVKTDLETGYSVNITGEQVQEILQIAVPTAQGADNGTDNEIKELLSQIKNLNLQMTARNDRLHKIEISGNADIGNKVVQVDIIISEFQILEAGEYVILDVIKDAVKTVDKDSLFSLTEDLYRLMVAFEQFAKQESQDGTVTLRADCGIIHFNQTYDLKDFENLGAGNVGNTDDTSNIGDVGNTDDTSNADDADNVDNSEDSSNSDDIGEGFVDRESIEKLPELIGFLCMEGKITSTEINNNYAYKLVLDEASMQKIAEMVVPDLVNYVVTMTEGTAVVMIENERISSISIEIEGSIKVFFSEVPAEVGVEFRY